MIRKIALFSALVLLVLAALWSSNWLRMYSAPLALVWPASGLAVFLFWRFGYRAALPIALASVVYSIYQDKAVLTVVTSAFAIVSTGAIALWALRQWRVDLAFQRAGDALKFFAVTIAATALSSLLTATLDILGSWSTWQEVSKVWWACWLAEAMGIILLLPVLTTCQQMKVKNWHELILITLAVVVNAWLVYGDVLPYGWAMSLPLTYTIFPLIIWASFRLNNPWLALLLLLNGAAGILGTRLSMGPFVLTSASESALALHGHLALVSITALMLSGAMVERQKTQQRLRANQEALARSSRINDMGQLAAGLAHELNQPLTAIMTFSQAAQRLVAQHNNDPDVQAAMQRVVANAQRASDIIKQMRAFVRNEVPNAEWHNVTTLVNDAVRLISFEAKRQHVPILVDIAEPVQVYVAEVSFHQVLVNLLQNSLEALAEHQRPEVRIKISYKLGKVTIVISDNGPGVPEHLISTLFDPFVSSKANGMGLGLNLSQSIIESFDGKLEYAGSKHGAVFTIQLTAEPVSAQGAKKEYTA
ncbi:ATP-binding protein [Salinibius halmophilus]|uniref:ATP-binding protein n=1 Tax=Salinibius halmophilus TaxID=1853216 RepID=UPI000E665A8F|nr:ATP-binding protein [Salinibius halmophilus]